ncbi:hypothetical protein [Klebsiella michiganensis]|uniref:hypothetical protein n=1 Tax=Klebsiella michiganensis TaxID=1134687 RepID=UPI002448F162|nr:hypothetical protein [Klebsiella michiganensis]MDG9770875.1 hypothetical protein [Klebsiella michiganensis]MDH0949538.1 hypothetical protein [Klebsiella michiganensis]MDH1030766.1 hypothetical protein [Klebsiella michiganensis]MDH1829570.1 hypothetical protein [Klebsiella michiganensis]MDH1833576.1 hypothetical protein [Klebsiella michiganensis]
MTINQRLNFAKSMNNFAEEKIAEAMQLVGKVLPATIVRQSGKMVTVSFSLTNIPFTLPQVTIPLFGPQYVRYPMQPGDRGIVIPADTYIGGMSGLGGGVADLTQPANLSALVYLPISHTEWQDVDGQVVTVYGPEGVTLRDSGSNTTFLLKPESIAISTPESFTVTVGGTVFSLTAGRWSLSGDAGHLQDSVASTSPAIMHAGWESLVAWLNSHEHSNGNDGNDTGGPTSTFNGSITE